MSSCRLCGLPFEKYTTRKSLKPAQKKAKSHHHYGTSYFQYGICEQSHYTRIKRLKTDWNPCKKCEQKKEDLAEKRRYIEAKKRKEKKEIPTFIRKEFDRFGKAIKEEIREEMRKEIRVELEAEMEEKVRYQVELTINRILNTPGKTPGEEQSLLEAPRVPPSPTSTMFSCSDGYEDM